MAESYDMEGYYCLMIAILMGVNAKEARILFDYGLCNPVSQKILKKRHPKNIGAVTRKERREAIWQMRKEGYSSEVIADALHCDSSTVKRMMKK